MFGKFIEKYNFLILLITILIVIISVLLFPQLKTEVSFEQFFPKNEPALTGYNSFVKKMGSTENSLVIVLSNYPSIFDSIFLKKIEKLQIHIDSMHGVIKTTSLLNLKKYNQLFPGSFSKIPYLHPSPKGWHVRDSIRIFKDFDITQHFISKDASNIRILIQLSDKLSLAAIDSLVQDIDRVSSVFKKSNVHMLGRKYMESEYKNLVNREMKKSILLSILFVIIILWFLHRTIAGVILPLLCMVVSLLMLYGYMALFQRPLTIMSNLFPTIILIVGISDVMHISSKVAFESLKSPNLSNAIQTTLKEIGLTTFINSFTTALGFLTLLTMSIQTLQSFGIDAAVGLMIAWVNSIFLLPALLIRFKLANSFIKPIKSDKWHGFLERILFLTYRYPKSIAITIMVILIISIIGLFNINTNNLLLTSLPKNNRMRTDFQFFDEKMEGGRNFELIIQTKNNFKLYHNPIIHDIEKLENYLMEKQGIKEIISPVLEFKWLNQAINNINLKLPDTQTDFDQLQFYARNNEDNLPVKLIDENSTTGRLYGKQKDLGRKKIEQINANILTWINQNIDTSAVKFEITGFDYMTDIGHKLRIENMTSSFLMEIIFVSIIIGLIYRSLIMILITFIANIIPVLIVGGIMGYLGIELRGTTTAIFAIGYVIAMDDTLHFVNRFQLEKRKGLTTEGALNKTFLYTGRAMVMTSMILLGGFLVLLHSSFGDVYMHGILISLIIFIALVTELFLTPVLINYFYSNK